MSDLSTHITEDYTKGIEAQHKLLNLLMGYWTVFASQKKEYDLQTRLMEEIKQQAECRLAYCDQTYKFTINNSIEGTK